MYVIHLIDEHGMVGEGVLRFPHQVQVGQSRLDHQHVGALKHDVKNAWMFNTIHLGHIPGSRPLSKSSGPTRQLVLLAVSKGRSRLGGLAERAVEAGGELDSIAQHGDPVAIAVVGKSLDNDEGLKRGGAMM